MSNAGIIDKIRIEKIASCISYRCGLIYCGGAVMSNVVIFTNNQYQTRRERA